MPRERTEGKKVLTFPPKTQTGKKKQKIRKKKKKHGKGPINECKKEERKTQGKKKGGFALKGHRERPKKASTQNPEGKAVGGGKQMTSEVLPKGRVRRNCCWSKKEQKGKKQEYGWGPHRVECDSACFRRRRPLRKRRFGEESIPGGGKNIGGRKNVKRKKMKGPKGKKPVPKRLGPKARGVTDAKNRRGLPCKGKPKKAKGLKITKQRRTGVGIGGGEKRSKPCGDR